MEVFDLPVWEVKFVRAYEDKLRVLETPEFKKLLQISGVQICTEEYEEKLRYIDATYGLDPPDEVVIPLIKSYKVLFQTLEVLLDGAQLRRTHQLPSSICKMIAYEEKLLLLEEVPLLRVLEGHKHADIDVTPIADGVGLEITKPRGPDYECRFVYLDHRVGLQTAQPQGKVYWDVEVDGEANGGDGISVGVAQTRVGLGDEATFHSSEAAMLFHVHGGLVYCGGDDWHVRHLQPHLHHFTLCFDHGARKLWIRPTPTDPTTRFLDVTDGIRLPEGAYHACVTIDFLGSRVRVREVLDGDGDLGGRFFFPLSVLEGHKHADIDATPIAHGVGLEITKPRGPCIKGSVFLDHSEPYGKVYWDVEVEGEANGGDGICVGVAQTRAGLGDASDSEAAVLFDVWGGLVFCGGDDWEVQGLPRHLHHFTLCFDYQFQRLWIRPTPTDPTTRFLDVMGGTTLPRGRYHVCVTMWLDSRVRVTNCDECGGWGPGWGSGRRFVHDAYDDDADDDNNWE